MNIIIEPTNELWLYERDFFEFACQYLSRCKTDESKSFARDLLNNPESLAAKRQAQKALYNTQFEKQLSQTLTSHNVTILENSFPRFCLLSSGDYGVSYYKNHDNFLRDSRTKISGKSYLALCSVPSERIANLWNKLINKTDEVYTLEKVDMADKARIRKVYECDPSACMSPQYPNALIRETTGKLWPCDVLVNSDLQLWALVENESGDILARALSLDERRTRCRAENGSDADLLAELLDAKGVLFGNGALYGAKLTKIEYLGGFVALWIDKYESTSGSYRYDDLGDYLKIVDDYNGIAADSEGYVEANRTTCGDCGEYVSEEDTYWIEHSEITVCECCFNSSYVLAYRYADREIDSGNNYSITANVSDCTQTESGTYYLDGASGLVRIGSKWFSEYEDGDDIVYSEYENDYILAENATYCSYTEGWLNDCDIVELDYYDSRNGEKIAKHSDLYTGYELSNGNRVRVLDDCFEEFLEDCITNRWTTNRNKTDIAIVEACELLAYELLDNMADEFNLILCEVA
jgi:hypothetical protein